MVDTTPKYVRIFSYEETFDNTNKIKKEKNPRVQSKDGNSRG